VRLLPVLLALGLGIGCTEPASADPWKDENGKGRRRGGYERKRPERRAFKQEYDDGNCKYERKLEKSGEYKEEVKCRGGRRPTYGYRTYAYPYRHERRPIWSRPAG
jgi:hypothetical protein